MNQINPFISSYVDAILWAEQPDNANIQWEVSMISIEAWEKIASDCTKFLTDQKFSNDQLSNAAHDFWLTRNGYGVGFWDGDWDDVYGEEWGDKITEYIEENFAQLDIYLGDDGKLYF